jgi:hypothetical protein
MRRTMLEELLWRLMKEKLAVGAEPSGVASSMGGEEKWH